MKRLVHKCRKAGRVVCAVAAAVLSTGCSGLDLINAVTPSDGVLVTPALAYGPHPRQQLDLYRPEGMSGPLPVILFLYGGSWKEGDRADYAFAGRTLARAGFLVAVADYRVYPEIAFPAFVTDTAKAVRWLSEHAGEHAGMTDRIHLVGHSAGAHIAAMTALDRRFLEAEGVHHDILGRWVGLAGPYAFYPSKTAAVSAVFEHLDDEDAARPITFVDEKSPPALLLHGADDSIVIPLHSEKLARAMNDAGVDAEAHFYDGIGHVKLLLSLSPPFTGYASSLADAARFLKSGAFPQANQTGQAEQGSYAALP
ncbi:alpha/beta hydrolase [Thalassospiraceae bacterium LMO-JJ14]|nr:alpha/beta hydrolase [Thalassospiraceae bacterium LMO-JJ14]